MARIPETDQRIRNRFKEVIEEGIDLHAKMQARYKETRRVDFRGQVTRSGSFGYVVEYRSLVEKYVALVSMVLPSTKHRNALLSDVNRANNRPGSLQAVIGNLRGIQDNYETGFYDDLKNRVVATVSSDYMEQAEALLNEGVAGQYDHVPAAVLCGAVLEDRLRRWCVRQSQSLSTKKSDGTNKTLGPLIEELRRNQMFDKQVLRQLQWWADIRNHAAHGEFDKFTREHVELMLRGVDNFFASDLTSA